MTRVRFRRPLQSPPPACEFATRRAACRGKARFAIGTASTYHIPMADKKNQNKTQPTTASVTAFLNAVEPARRRADGLLLAELFGRVTGFDPVMWGPSIVGYGRYHYRYTTGREGDFLATGFSPRKSALSLYIMPGYQDYDTILARLGKHKTGASCLYINKLDDVDLSVLEELIRIGLEDLNRIWPVQPH